MDYLKTGGYQTITAKDLALSRLSGRPLPASPVVLTFDDAFTDFADLVVPALKAHDFRATLYIPTAYVGRTACWLRGCGEEGRPMLSWTALRELSVDGIELAAHSHTHPQLDRISAAEVQDETRRSKQIVEDQIGQGIEGFAYPFGYWNRVSRAAVKAAGFRYACAVSELMAVPGDDMYTMPRLTVNAHLDLADFARLLTSWPTPRDRWTAEGKRIVWREMRRRVRSIAGDPREGATSPPVAAPSTQPPAQQPGTSVSSLAALPSNTGLSGSAAVAWADAALGALGAPATSANVQTMADWFDNEGTPHDLNNPLNLQTPYGGSAGEEAAED